jgi:geranylgeranyl pyrophosphate synthase
MKKRNERLAKTGEELFAIVKELCEREGAMGWKLAQKTMFKTRSRNRKLHEAIGFAMRKYRPDYFRPALLSFTCKAVGGEKETTVSMGAALTLFAWAIGIHDDIIDQSRTKDGQPTIHGKFGRDLALILSDVLLFKGFALLRERLESDTPVNRLAKILEAVEKIWFEQSEGEAFEIQHRGLVNVTPQECLKKIRMRASEIDACARIGGILGGGTPRQVEKLGEYGRLVGMMGILRNEIIDMLDSDALRHRICKESLPLPIIYALQEPSVRPKLTQLMDKGRLAEEDLKIIARLSDDSQGIEKTANLIRNLSEKAHGHARNFKNEELELLAAPFQISPEEWKQPLSN